MTRTMWIAFFCLVISVGSIAIRVAMPQASLFAEAVPDQDKIGMAAVPNELAKSDRLELPNIRAETAIAPAAQAAPVEAPSTKIETTKAETTTTDTNKTEMNNSPPALARRQRQRRSARTASSTQYNERAE